MNVKKVSSSVLQYIAVYSPDSRYDDLFLSNYVRINLLDRIGSIPGVGEALIPGAREYGMRIWLNPDKLAKLGMTAGDVREAIAAQNRQNPAGSVGQPPARGGVEVQYPVNAPGRLLERAQFEDVVVRAQGDGSLVRVRDIGRGGGPLGVFYRGFNRAFAWSTRGYLAGVVVLLRRSAIALVALVAVYGVAFGLLRTLPTGFLPEEDQGAFFVAVRLPDGASLERTEIVTKRLEEILKSTPGIESVVTLGGFDIITGTNNANVASLVGILHEWEKRKVPDEQIGAIIGHVQTQFSTIPGALIFAFNLPPILGLGTAGGFEMNVQDRAGRDLGDLAAASGGLLAAAATERDIAGATSPFRVTVPQLTVSLDRDKARTLGVPVGDVYDALQTFLGGLYVNDFNLYGRTWRVLLQGDADFRRQPDDIDRFYVRAGDGSMVPLSTLVSIRPTSGPEVIYRYNRYRAARIFGAVSPGVSAGQGNAVMERLTSASLPSGFGYEWTGTVYQQKRAEGREGILFGLSAVLVFLLLAALYESWSIPFAVVAAVPLGIFGALAGLWLSGRPYDVYTQIGIITLIGLAAKNAILIVEFAKLKHEQGRSLAKAALEAASLRLRPILMTSFAFIVGVVPLLVATGAVAGARRSLGVAVFWGMLAATILAIFIVPVLYVVVAGLAERARRRGERALAAGSDLASQRASHAG